jgi:alkylation response protein AidB-like acyl-CoA dehydrogenase
MRFDWPEEQIRFRAEVHEFALAHQAPPSPSEDIDAVDKRSRQNLLELDELGWLRISWPTAIGGGGRSPWYQFLLALELGYHDVDYGRMGTSAMIAPAIQKFGTEEQARELVPKIWSGEVTCALGYSEPDAGSDLASLRTRAVRDGDEFVINGSKIWTSNAHRNTHVWLACRTNPDAPKHRGISILLVPLSTPGITIRPIWIMSGHRTNEVFFDDVRVPTSALVGEEDRGWYMISNALDHERVTIGVNNYIELVHLFERSIAYLKTERPDVLADPIGRARLAALKLDLHMLRGLLYQCSATVAAGDAPTKHASMVKVWATELRLRMTDAFMDMLGRVGMLERSSPSEDAPLDGRIGQMYRHSAQARFTGGANEIQKTIIAERGLGLPRGA